MPTARSNTVLLSTQDVQFARGFPEMHDARIRQLKELIAAGEYPTDVMIDHVVDLLWRKLKPSRGKKQATCC